MPDQIEAAGGICALGESGHQSERISWETLAACKPDIVVCAFCGFNLAENEQRLGEVAGLPEWEAIASRTRVIASDANAFFSRPGPRLIEGVEQLAYIMHGDEIPELAPPVKGQISELIDGEWIDLSMRAIAK